MLSTLVSLLLLVVCLYNYRQIREGMNEIERKNRELNQQTTQTVSKMIKQIQRIEEEVNRKPETLYEVKIPQRTSRVVSRDRRSERPN